MLAANPQPVDLFGISESKERVQCKVHLHRLAKAQLVAAELEFLSFVRIQLQDRRVWVTVKLPQCDSVERDRLLALFADLGARLDVLDGPGRRIGKFLTRAARAAEEGIARAHDGVGKTRKVIQVPHGKALDGHERGPERCPLRFATACLERELVPTRALGCVILGGTLWLGKLTNLEEHVLHPRKCLHRNMHGDVTTMAVIRHLDHLTKAATPTQEALNEPCGLVQPKRDEETQHLDPVGRLCLFPRPHPIVLGSAHRTHRQDPSAAMLRVLREVDAPRLGKDASNLSVIVMPHAHLVPEDG
mmetsp:Transcript_19039/g.38800  ORF Transcript_19039/g.38800 Transcript_19039/m.38800 type:complete len:303 (-) Transcript_19039:443-1351(-)